MTSSEPRRRRDVKTQDREKSLSPLDKDQLKRRCLERVRSERSRLMARVRGRRGLEGARELSDGADRSDLLLTPSAAAAAAAAAEGEGQNTAFSPGQHALSSAREILRQGLSELSGGNGTRQRLRGQGERHPDPSGKQTPSPRLPESQAVQANLDRRGISNGPWSSSSFLSAIEEENASYRQACSRGRGSPKQPPQSPALRNNNPRGGDASGAVLAPGSTSIREQTQGLGERESGDGEHMADDSSREGESTVEQPQQQQQQQESDAMVEGDEPVWDDGYRDEAHLLSPEEYLEMMRYIEEACKEEDLRAEAEALEEYEMTKRLEEEEVEYAISSCLDGVDSNGQDENTVLCPVCKRNYLLQGAPPSGSIFCACGFRLDTGGDRLGLEHLKEQLAETYSQHSAACSAEPTFVVEGTAGLDVLWSSCDVCGFARVVL